MALRTGLCIRGLAAREEPRGPLRADVQLATDGRPPTRPGTANVPSARSVTRQPRLEASRSIHRPPRRASVSSQLPAQRSENVRTLSGSPAATLRGPAGGHGPPEVRGVGRSRWWVGALWALRSPHDANDPRRAPEAGAGPSLLTWVPGSRSPLGTVIRAFAGFWMVLTPVSTELRWVHPRRQREGLFGGEPGHGGLREAGNRRLDDRHGCLGGPDLGMRRGKREPPQTLQR